MAPRAERPRGGGGPARGVRPRAARRAGRAPLAKLARRAYERPRVPGGLRRRRERPLRAARRDWGPALARGVPPPRAARRRPVRRRGARGLLPDAWRRGAAGRAEEGLRRPSDPVG